MVGSILPVVGWLFCFRINPWTEAIHGLRSIHRPKNTVRWSRPTKEHCSLVGVNQRTLFVGLGQPNKVILPVLWRNPNPTSGRMNFLWWQKGWPNRLEIPWKAHLSFLFSDPNCGRNVAYPCLDDFSVDSMAVEFHFIGFHGRGILFMWFHDGGISWIPWQKRWPNRLEIPRKAHLSILFPDFSLILPVVGSYPTSGRMKGWTEAIHRLGQSME